MSTKMSEPRDVFLHELGDVLCAERTLVKSLTPEKERRRANDQAGAVAGVRVARSVGREVGIALGATTEETSEKGGERWRRSASRGICW